MRWMRPKVVIASAKKTCYATPLIQVVPWPADSIRSHSGVDEDPEVSFVASLGSLGKWLLRSAKKHPAVVFAVQRGKCLYTDC